MAFHNLLFASLRTVIPVGISVFVITTTHLQAFTKNALLNYINRAIGTVRMVCPRSF